MILWLLSCSRFFPKRYFESEVFLSHSVLMFSFNTGFKRFLHSADICLCALPIKVTESTMWPKTFLTLGGLFSFCASISSLDISRAADVAKTNPFWISDNLLSALLWDCLIFLFFATVSFNIGTHTPLQFAEIFKASRFLFTTTGFFRHFKSIFHFHLCQLVGYDWP